MSPLFCFNVHFFVTVYIIVLEYINYAILVLLRRVHLEEQGTKVETVRFSPDSSVGRDSRKSVYSTMSMFLKFTAKGLRHKVARKKRIYAQIGT